MRADPIRVAMASAQAFPLLGGVESHIDEVAARLVERGLSVELFSTDRSGSLPSTGTRNGARINRFRSWPRSRDYFASPGLFAGLLRADFDLVHVQGIHTLVPPTAMLAAVLRRKPFVVTFHTGGHSGSLRNRLRDKQFAALAPLIRRAAGWIAVSEYEAAIFADVIGVPVERISLIRNGGVGLTPADVPVEPDLIVSPGRLERYKGHHRAIEALPHIVQRAPNARLKILGSGPYEPDLRRLAERLGVADRVTIEFVPPERRSAMAEELGRAAVVSLLSDYESHPVAITEALSLGRPVVALDNSGVSELIRAGLVHGVPSDATESQIALALLEQLRSTQPAARPQLPTWDECVTEIVAVYRSVLQQADGELTSTAAPGMRGKP